MKVIVGITGASGMIYAKVLLQKLLQFDVINRITVVASEVGEKVWQTELSVELDQFVGKYNEVKLVTNKNFFADIASGSAGYDIMFIVPCSMNTLAKVANGMADSLLLRAADVILKERKQLLLAIREAPYNLIHIENMKQITLAGGIVFSLSPSFYYDPKGIDDLVNNTVDRLLSVVGLLPQNMYQWGK